MTDLGQIVAQVGFLLDEGDQSILDLQEDGGAGLDLLAEGTVG